MAEVAMAVFDKRYYIKNAKYECKKQSLYTSVIDSHIENNKNWNGEFSCGARRRCDDVFYVCLCRL